MFSELGTETCLWKTRIILFREKLTFLDLGEVFSVSRLSGVRSQSDTAEGLSSAARMQLVPTGFLRMAFRDSCCLWEMTLCISLRLSVIGVASSIFMSLLNSSGSRDDPGRSSPAQPESVVPTGKRATAARKLRCCVGDSRGWGWVAWCSWGRNWLHWVARLAWPCEVCEVGDDLSSFGDSGWRGSAGFARRGLALVGPLSADLADWVETSLCEKRTRKSLGWAETLGTDLME